MNQIEILKKQYEQLGKAIESLDKSNNTQAAFVAEIRAKNAAKGERLEKFAAAITSYKQKDLKDSLAAAGFVCGFTSADKSTTQWGCKSKPGVLIKITNGKFTVYKNNEVTHRDRPVEYIKAFLSAK